MWLHPLLGCYHGRVEPVDAEGTRQHGNSPNIVKSSTSACLHSERNSDRVDHSRESEQSEQQGCHTAAEDRELHVIERRGLEDGVKDIKLRGSDEKWLDMVATSRRTDSERDSLYITIYSPC